VVLRGLWKLHNAMKALARALALAGGAVLLGVIGVTCASILGRQVAGVLNGTLLQANAPELAQALLAIGIGPVVGDYELVELGMAVAIFCFLPYCHLTMGHARVDLFLSRRDSAAPRLLAAMTEALFAIALTLIAWRLAVGTLGRVGSGQTSYLLQVPLWFPYALAVAAACIAVAASLSVLALRVASVITRQHLLPDRPEGGG
jgi:TRAP-type C4-dicarboxylate transport system permease small subunit